MSNTFDPKIIFHNSDTNTTVSVTVVDSVLNALTVNEEVALTFNYEDKDIDSEGYVTFENRVTALAAMNEVLEADLLFERPRILKPLYNYDRFYGDLQSSDFVGKIPGITHIRTIWTISRAKDFNDTHLAIKNEVITVDRGDLTRAQVIFNSEDEIYVKVTYVAEYTDGVRKEVELSSLPKLCNSKITKPIRARNIKLLDEDGNAIFQPKFSGKRKNGGKVEGIYYLIGMEFNQWYETTIEGLDVPLGGSPEPATRVVVKVYNRNPQDPVLPSKYGEKFTNIEGDEKFNAACLIGKTLATNANNGSNDDFFILGSSTSDGSKLDLAHTATEDTYHEYFSLDSDNGELVFNESNQTLRIEPFKLWQSKNFKLSSFCYIVTRIYRNDGGVEQYYKNIKLDLLGSMLEKENAIVFPANNFRDTLNIDKPYELSKYMNSITLNFDDKILGDIHESTKWEIVGLQGDARIEDYKIFNTHGTEDAPMIFREAPVWSFTSSVFKKSLGYSVDNVMVLEEMKDKMPANYNYSDKGWWTSREYKSVLPVPSISTTTSLLKANNFYATGDSFCFRFGLKNAGVDFLNSLTNMSTYNFSVNVGDKVKFSRGVNGAMKVTHNTTLKGTTNAQTSSNHCFVVVIKNQSNNNVLYSGVLFEKNTSVPTADIENQYEGLGLDDYIGIRTNTEQDLSYWTATERLNVTVTVNRYTNVTSAFNVSSSFNTPAKRYEEFKRLNNLSSINTTELTTGYVGLPIHNPAIHALVMRKIKFTESNTSLDQYRYYIKITLTIRNAISGMEATPIFIPLELGKVNKYRGFNRNDHFINSVWKHNYLASGSDNSQTDEQHDGKYVHRVFNPTTTILNPLGNPYSAIHDYRRMKNTTIGQCLAMSPEMFFMKTKQEFKSIIFDSVEQLAYYIESLTRYAEAPKTAKDKLTSGLYDEFDLGLSRQDKRRVISIKTTTNVFNHTTFSDARYQSLGTNDKYYYYNPVTNNRDADMDSSNQMAFIATDTNGHVFSDDVVIFKETYLQSYESILAWLKMHMTNGEMNQRPFIINVYDVLGAPTTPKFREAIVVTISKDMVDKGKHFIGHDDICNDVINLKTIDAAKTFPTTTPVAMGIGPVSLSYDIPNSVSNKHPSRYSERIIPTGKIYSTTVSEELDDGKQGKVCSISSLGMNVNESAFKLSSQVDLFNANFDYFGFIPFKECTENSLLGFKGDFLNIEEGYKKGQEVVDPLTGALYLCIKDYYTYDRRTYFNKPKVDARHMYYNSYPNPTSVLNDRNYFIKISDHSLDFSTQNANTLAVISKDLYKKYYKSSLPTYVALLSYLNLILPSHEGLLFDPTIGDKNKKWFDVLGSEEGDGSMNQYRVYDLPNVYSGEVYKDVEEVFEEEDTQEITYTFREHYATLYGSCMNQTNSTGQFNGTNEAYTFADSMNKILSYLSNKAGGISATYNNSRFSIDLWEYWKIIRENFAYRGTLQDLALNFGMGGTYAQCSISGCRSYKLTLYSEGEEFRVYNSGALVSNLNGSWSRSYAQVFWIYNKTDKTVKCILFNNLTSSNIDTTSLERVSFTYRDFRTFSSDMTLYEETFNSPKEIAILKADLQDSQYLKYNRTLNGSYGSGGEYDLYRFNDVDMISSTDRSLTINDSDEINIEKNIKYNNHTGVSIYGMCRMIKDSPYTKFNIARAGEINITPPYGTGATTTLNVSFNKIDTWSPGNGSHWIMQVNEFIDAIGYTGGLQDFYQNFGYASGFSNFRFNSTGSKIKLTVYHNGTNYTFKTYIDNSTTPAATVTTGWGTGWTGLISVTHNGMLINGYLWNKESSGTSTILSNAIKDKYKTMRDLSSASSTEIEMFTVDVGTSGNLRICISGFYPNTTMYTSFTQEDCYSDTAYYKVDKPAYNSSISSSSGGADVINYIKPLSPIDTPYSNFELYCTRGFSNQHSGGRTLFKTYQQALQSFLGSDYGKSFVMRTQQFIDAIGYTGGLQNFYQNYEATDSNMDSYKDFTNCSDVEIKINNDIYEVWNNGSKVGYIGEGTSWNENWDGLVTVLKDGEMYDTFIVSILNTSSHSGVSSAITSKYDSFVNLTSNSTLTTVYRYTFSQPCTLRFFMGNILPSTNIYTDFSSNLFYSTRDSNFRIPNPLSGGIVRGAGVDKKEFSLVKNYAKKSTFPYRYLEEYFKAYKKYDSDTYLPVNTSGSFTLLNNINTSLREVQSSLPSLPSNTSVSRFSCSVEDFAKIFKLEDVGSVKEVFNKYGKTLSYYVNDDQSSPKRYIKRNDSSRYSFSVISATASYSESITQNIQLPDNEGYVAIITQRFAPGSSEPFIEKSVCYVNLSATINVNVTANTSYTNLFKAKYPSVVTDFTTTPIRLLEIDYIPDYGNSYWVVEVKYIKLSTLRTAMNIETTTTKEAIDDVVFGGWLKFKNKNYNNVIYVSSRPVLWVKDIKTIASANIAHPRQSIIRIGLKHYYVRLMTDRFYPDDDCCLDSTTLAGQQTSQPDFDTFNDPWCLNFRESLITPTIMSLCMLTNKYTMPGFNNNIDATGKHILSDITSLYYSNGENVLTPTKNYMIYSSNLMKRNAFFNEHGTVLYSAIPYKSPYHAGEGYLSLTNYSYMENANLCINNSDVAYNLHISQPAFEYGSDATMFGKNEIVFGQPVKMSGFYLNPNNTEDRLIFTYVRSVRNKVNDNEYRYSTGPYVKDNVRSTGYSLSFKNGDTIDHDNEGMNVFQDYHPVHIVLEAIEEKDLPIYNIKDSLSELLKIDGVRTTGALSSLLTSDNVSGSHRYVDNVSISNISQKSNMDSITTDGTSLEIGVKKIPNSGHVVPYISKYKPHAQMPSLSTHYEFNRDNTTLYGNYKPYAGFKTADTYLEQTSPYGQWISQLRRTWGTLELERLYNGQWGSYGMNESSSGTQFKLYDRWSGVGYLGTISSVKSISKNTNGVSWTQGIGIYNTLTSQLEKILRHRLVSSDRIREDDKGYIPVCHVFYYKGKIVLIPRETSFNIYEPDMYGFNYTKDMEYLEYGRTKPIDRTTRDVSRVKLGLNIMDPFLPYLSNDRSLHSLQELVRDIIPLYVKR